MITAEYLEAEIAAMKKIMENPNHQDDFTKDIEILNLALGALRDKEKVQNLEEILTRAVGMLIVGMTLLPDGQYQNTKNQMEKIIIDARVIITGGKG